MNGDSGMRSVQRPRVWYDRHLSESIVRFARAWKFKLGACRKRGLATYQGVNISTLSILIAYLVM